MAVGDLGLMDALRTRMQWHQARQRLLAENVANADTPGFRGKDLKAPDLPQAADSAASGGVAHPRVAAVTLAVTSAGHAAGVAPSGRGFEVDRTPAFEVTANGNAVDIEEQMARSAENQLDYQTVATLYQQSLSLIRTALGRK